MTLAQMQQGMGGISIAGKPLMSRQTSIDEGESFTSTNVTRVAVTDVSTDCVEQQRDASIGSYGRSHKTPVSVQRGGKYKSRTPNPISIAGGQQGGLFGGGHNMSFEDLQVQGHHLGMPDHDDQRGGSSSEMELYVAGRGIQLMDQTPIPKVATNDTSPEQLTGISMADPNDSSPFNLSSVEDPGSSTSPYRLRSPGVLDFSGIPAAGGIEDDLGVSRLRDIEGVRHFDEDPDPARCKPPLRHSVYLQFDEGFPSPFDVTTPSTTAPSSSSDTGLFAVGTMNKLPPPAPSAEKHRPNKDLCERVDYTGLLQENIPPLLRCNSALMYDSHYELVEKIGSGSFGEVWSARHHRTKTMFALKKSKHKYRGIKDKKMHIRELQSVSLLAPHPNIVRYYRAWQDAGHFFIVMELCDGGTLEHLLEETHKAGKRLDVMLIKCLSCGLFRGLSEIHKQGLLHLDLKPDNLFLTEDCGRVKIGDFGLCIKSNDWDDEEGDREYLAEELLRCEASSAADIFSAGLILFQMLGGITRLPGNGEAWHNLREERVNVVDYAVREGYDLGLVSQAMIRKNPLERPTAQQLLQNCVYADVPPSPKMEPLVPPIFARWTRRGSLGGSCKHLDVMDVIDCSLNGDEDDDIMEEG